MSRFGAILGGFCLGLLCGLFVMSSARQHSEEGLVLRLTWDPAQAEPMRSSYHLTEAPGEHWHDWMLVTYQSRADAARAAKAAVAAATLDREQGPDARGGRNRHVRDPTVARAP